MTDAYHYHCLATSCDDLCKIPDLCCRSCIQQTTCYATPCAQSLEGLHIGCEDCYIHNQHHEEVD